MEEGFEPSEEEEEETWRGRRKKPGGRGGRNWGKVMGEEEGEAVEEAAVDLNLEAVRGENDEKTGTPEIVRVMMLEACSTDNSSGGELDEDDDDDDDGDEKHNEMEQ